MVTGIVAALVAIGVAGCSTTPTKSVAPTGAPFGQAPDGTPVTLYTLRNASGVTATICNYGGIVTSLQVPDRNGAMGDVVLGYDSLAGYLKDSPYFGSLIGRYGNRTAKEKSKLMQFVFRSVILTGRRTTNLEKVRRRHKAPFRPHFALGGPLALDAQRGIGDRLQTRQGNRRRAALAPAPRLPAG